MKFWKRKENKMKKDKKKDEVKVVDEVDTKVTDVTDLLKTLKSTEEPKKEEKPTLTMSSIAYKLFKECFLDYMKIKESVYNSKFKLTTYVQEGSEDDVVCYILVPMSNQDVSIYFDDNVVNAEYKNKQITLSLEDTEALAKNVAKYVRQYRYAE